MSTTRSRRHFAAPTVIAYVFIALVFVVVVGPAAYALLTSLQPRNVSLLPQPTYLFTPTFENYFSLFNKYSFGPYFVNSFVSSLGATLVGLVVGIPAAYALSRAEFRGKNAVFLSLLITRALPAIGVAVPYFVFFTAIHVVDSLFALIVVYSPFCIGLVTWLMQNYFDTVPRSLDEAASLDGSRRFGILWRIVLPLSGPGIAATGIFAFLFGWNNFLYPLVLTQSRATTVPVALTQFVGEYTVNWGQIMAGIVVMSLPLVVFAILFRRYMVAGLGQGAVKE
jgi:multiple sugar transport system permease protein